MSLFDWLLVAHLTGDFLLQTHNMAEYKATDWSWMLKHIAVYMTLMTAVLVGYGWSARVPFWMLMVAWLFLAGTHIVLDRREFTLKWMRITRVSPDHPWMPIMIDQVFHLLVLAATAQVLVLFSG